MANWLQKISGKMSDAIPNEFSQLNGFSKFLPPPFSTIVQTPAALDRFGETYSNSEGSTSDLFDSGLYGAQAFAGQGGDPNKYGTGEKNWADQLGQVGNVAGMFAGSNGGFSMPGGSGAKSSGSGSGSGSMDFGKILGMFGGQSGGQTTDFGSGDFIRGSAATDNPSTGGFDDNNFDVSKLFEAFQKMQGQQGQESYSPQQESEMIKSKYPFIPQEVFSKWLAQQPQTGYQIAG